MASTNPRFGSSGQNSLESAAQGVKEKAEGVAGTLSDTASAVKQNVTQMASQAGDTAEKAWNSTRHYAEDIGSDIAHRAESMQADVEIFIRRNPIAVVMGALGLGVLLGAAVFAGSRR